MKTSTKTTNAGLSIKTNIKAGGMKIVNHNRLAIKVRSAIKAGGMKIVNHNRALASVR